MVDKVLAAFVVIDGLFAAQAALMLGFSVVVMNMEHQTPTDGRQAARELLFEHMPLTVFMLATFAITLPALVYPARGWLKASIYPIVFNAVFSLVLGLDMWILTLRTKEEFFGMWLSQSGHEQSLFQQTFNCCGYYNSTTPAFVTDGTCPSPVTAALMKGCAAPVTAYANIFMDQIFTTVFGMVGLDVVLILAVACMLKDRKERARFRIIDEKSGARSTL